MYAEFVRVLLFFFSSRRRHTRSKRDWSSDVCSSDLCLIYGNYLKNTQGIRFSGDRHQIFSNYLEGNSIAITVCNGDGEVATGSQLTCHEIGRASCRERV